MEPAEARAALARGLSVGQQLCRIFDVDGEGFRWFTGTVLRHVYFEDAASRLCLNVVVEYEDGDSEEMPVWRASLALP